MDFDYAPIEYVSSYHAEERLVERGEVTKDKAQQMVLNLAKNGELVVEVEDYRYLKSGEYYLPCVQHRELEGNIYCVKSILTWDMVDYRLQNIIDNYHIKKKGYSVK